MTIIYFIIALSILIIVHEFGHFIVARLSKIRVEKFSVGFGPKLFGVKRGDTEYKVSMLPLGGYVKMSGEDINDLDRNDEHAFYNKPVGVRACVVAAGPIMNIILCVILMPIVFMIGKDVPSFFYQEPKVIEVRADSPASKAGIDVGDIFTQVGSKDAASWKDVMDDVLISENQDLNFTINRKGRLIEKTVRVEGMPGGSGGYIGVEPHLFIGNEAVIDNVIPGSPAEKAGIKPGDRVVSMGGKPVESWTDMVEGIAKNKDSEIAINVLRDGKEQTLTIKPEYSEDTRRYVIGVSKDISKRDIPMTEIRYGFFESIKEGLLEAGRLAGLTFTVLGKLVTLKLSYKALGGPIKIAQITAEAARSGISSFLYFLSFLSLQLGILNLLPVPVLDGGHLVFFGVEAIRRKPLSEKIMNVAQQVGLGLIILLLVLVSINDVMNIEYIRNIFGKLF